jgi:site-specific DNA recombinase
LKENNPFPSGAVVAGYFRDSGGDEQDLSVDRQIGEFRRWLAEHALVEGRVFSDVARPGSTVVGREAFAAMVRHFRSGGAREAGLVVWRSNRFGRNMDDTQFYRADLRRQGYVVYSLTDHIPPDRYGKLIEFVLDWKDEEFLHALSEDVSSGLRHIVQNFGAVPGTPPHGFLREPVTVGTRRDGRPHILHRWSPDETLAPLVRRAFEMLVHGEPLSRIHLATGLYGSRNSYVTFFRNPLYKGELRFGDLVVPDYCQPVVKPDLWELAQRVLDQRAGRRSARPGAGVNIPDPRRINSPWLLSGLLHCARCGSPMNGHVIRSWTYYTCSRAHRRRDCDAPLVRAEVIEAAVLEHVRAYLADPSNLAALQSEQHRLYQLSASDLPDRMKEISVRLGNLRRKIGNLVDSIEEQRASPAILERLTALEVQEYELKEELAELRRMAGAVPASLDEAELAAVAADLDRALGEASPSEQRRVLGGWVAKVMAERKGQAITGEILLFLPPSEVQKKPPDLALSGVAPPWGHLSVTIEFGVPIVYRKRGRKARQPLP